MDVQPCLTKLLDPYTVLGMAALLPLLEAVDNLITFAQKRDVYICDFVAALKVCQGQLYSLYEDQATRFSTDEFWAYKNLLDCSHEHVHWKWITDLNDNTSQLAFVCSNEQIFAVHEGSNVSRELFGEIVQKILTESAVAASTLIKELDNRFLSQNLMQAMGILYPQYWLQGDCEESFSKHIRVLMDHYGRGRILGKDDETILVPALIDRELLLSQQGLFKLTMLSNARAAMEPPFDCNPLTRLWKGLDAATCLTHHFSEYMKLAEMAIVHVLGSVEDERVFSSVAFLKSKVRNSLETHLQCVVGMYSQKIYTLETFPYDAAFQKWLVGGERYRYGLLA